MINLKEIKEKAERKLKEFSTFEEREDFAAWNLKEEEVLIITLIENLIERKNLEKGVTLIENLESLIERILVFSFIRKEVIKRYNFRDIGIWLKDYEGGYREEEKDYEREGSFSLGRIIAKKIWEDDRESIKEQYKVLKKGEK